MSLKRALPFLVLTACSEFGVTDSLDHQVVTVTGPLTLTVSDTLSQMGIFWALPRVQVAPQSIVASNTMYGSLCLLDVTGTSTIAGSAVTLDITFSERLTSCANEVRALSYKAQVNVTSGTHEVFLVHHANNRVDTLVHQVVGVP